MKEDWLKRTGPRAIPGHALEITARRWRQEEMKAEAIDHICIAVKDLKKAQKIYEETLGLKLAVKYVAESEKIHVARYYLGDVALEPI